MQNPKASQDPRRRRRRSPPGRLLVASNRLPITIRIGPGGTERFRSSGGLVAAFEPTLRRLGGVWIGWPGGELQASDSLGEPTDPFRLEPVRIARGELKGYYHGFSNRTLWPLLHTMPQRASFEAADWEAYTRVNTRFAEVTARHLRAGDTVWINDYQLFCMPGALRRRHSRAVIGFFLHVPFPPYDVFRVLPWSKRILREVLAADLIGFHVPGYVRNFLDCAERLLEVSVDRRRRTVRYEGRLTRVVALPLGIDFQRFDELARQAPASRLGEDQRLILGVDRMDYTKGIPQRLRAFARLLARHPGHRGQVTLLQLAVPSRSAVEEYRELKRDIDRLVGQINGQFGTERWTPIRYLYRSVAPERLAGWYRDADVALITPLRDGMNLVAKEFVACQVADPGALVLSHLAGAAETMPEALLVNPYAIDDTAATLHAALEMPLADRRRRMQLLRRRERSADVHAWADRFMRRLRLAAAANER